MDNPKKGRSGAPKPIRAVIADLDQELLRLLLRRANLLEKIRDKGRIPPADEKFLREAWQNDIARVSKDPQLAGTFFSLLQQISFLPKPSPGDDASASGSAARTAFNLAPAQRPVRFEFVCPLSAWQTAAWLYLAAAAGQPLSISPALQDDGLVDFIRCLAQMEAAVTRDNGTVLARKAAPMGAPDKVIHAGVSEFGLYLIMAHYLGRHSHVKLTGEGPLSLINLSGLRHFLPELGCRLINIVPKSDSLPIRLEASGILPAAVTPGPEIPALFVEALLFAAPFYAAPFGINLGPHPSKAEILARTLPLLEASGAVFSLDQDTVSLEPASLVIPASPKIAMEPELAVFLLGFAFALGGKAILKGIWPDWPSAKDLWQVCAANGFRLGDGNVHAAFAGAQNQPKLPVQGRNQEWLPFFSALAACGCLNGGNVSLDKELLADAQVVDFLRVAGIEADEDGLLRFQGKYSGRSFTAQTPQWAMAFALAAASRKDKTGWPLGNPGIITEFWPLFWQFYNGLPEPILKERRERQEPAKVARRRIVTNAVAVPPELREEDWER